MLARIRKLQRGNRLQKLIDIEVLIHVDAMVKDSAKRLIFFRIKPAARPKYIAYLYNQVVAGRITTQQDMDNHFLDWRQEVQASLRDEGRAG